MKRAFILAALIGAAMTLTACATNGEFDPVKTQVSAHNDHAAGAAAAQVSAEQGLLKGVNATAAAKALDQTEAAITVADAVLQVADNADVIAAARSDNTATAAADKALTKASRQ